MAMSRLATKTKKLSKSILLADKLTDFFGSVPFLLGNLFLFVIWIGLNSPRISGIEPIDPYPFNLLTMIVSLEAIFLSIIVLMSQNRASRLADIREELDFAVNVRAEKEVAEIIRQLNLIEKKLHIKTKNDPDFSSAKDDLDLEQLADRLVEKMRTKL